jgi:CHAD domain-containing protein
MDIRPDLPLAKFARAQALERLAEVDKQMRWVRRHADPDAVHDMRVAIRRFSSVLQVFPACFSAKRAAKGRKRLKRILKLAGEVRDRDIALELAAQADAAQDGLGSRLERERRQAARNLRRALRRDARVQTLAAAKRAVKLPKATAAQTEPGGWRPEAPSNENAVERLPELIGDLFEAGRRTLEPPADPAELHALRLKTKRRRYTLELFTPCYGPDLTERIGQLKRLQDLLGEINDCRASKDLAEGEDMSAYLESERERLIADLTRYWREVFDAPGECEGWMLELARRSAAKAAGAGR